MPPTATAAVTASRLSSSRFCHTEGQRARYPPPAPAIPGARSAPRPARGMRNAGSPKQGAVGTARHGGGRGGRRQTLPHALPPTSSPLRFARYGEGRGGRRQTSVSHTGRTTRPTPTRQHTAPHTHTHTKRGRAVTDSGDPSSVPRRGEGRGGTGRAAPAPPGGQAGGGEPGEVILRTARRHHGGHPCPRPHTDKRQAHAGTHGGRSNVLQ
jgi:hypothetical protein